ncbi:transient receptor potential cation channel subfa mily m member 2 [Trichuris trichiura]|uniref:Transient receptor potential cation channel subfa mily m member 2 n=1 Tax=Trichuris trichiura TaxID=36087 RepID=A0A077ZNH8_TRITR|nr:transient receptor potential cation channel subfa mily m member 2 [Trichuris trichiura]
MTDVHTKTEGFTDLEDFNCKYHVHEEICNPKVEKCARNGGIQLPQLQLPEYLRSRDAKILWYEPANLESFNGYSSGSREVVTTRWIRNTYERTGFSGMGKLPEYGPNKALYLLITR